MYKNGWKKRKFWQQKNKKSDFYNKTKTKKNKIDDIDVNEILVSKKEPYGTNNSFKYFTEYNDNVIRPLCVRLPQMTCYAKKATINNNKQ